MGFWSALLLYTVPNRGHFYTFLHHTRYELFDKLVSQSFENDPIFVEAMDKAFIRIINNNQITQMARNASKSPQMLVLYCDQLLSGRGYKGGKVLEEVVSYSFLIIPIHL